jgi:hypothetical protein
MVESHGPDARRRRDSEQEFEHLGAMGIDCWRPVVGLAVALYGSGGKASAPIPSSASPVANAPIPPPPVASPTPIAPLAREFANRTPRQLLALYEGKTPFHADKLIEPFKGLWIEAESRVLNILPDGPGRSIVVLRDDKDTIECRVGPQWSNVIARLDIGETLRVRGKISDSQNGQQLYLLECDVVPIEAPQEQKKSEASQPPPPAPTVEAPIAPPPATPATPATPPAEPPRKFVDAHVTPEYLLGLYEGNTTLRAETLVSEQIDKWMTLSGPLGEIHPGRPIFDVTVSPTLVSFAHRADKKTVIYMWFSGEWIARLALLSRNQNISVVGQLKKVTSYNSTIQFENCELVESNPETPAPTAPAPDPKPSARPRRRQSAKGKQARG